MVEIYKGDYSGKEYRGIVKDSKVEVYDISEYSSEKDILDYRYLRIYLDVSDYEFFIIMSRIVDLGGEGPISIRLIIDSYYASIVDKLPEIDKNSPLNDDLDFLIDVNMGLGLQYIANLSRLSNPHIDTVSVVLPSQELIDMAIKLSNRYYRFSEKYINYNKGYGGNKRPIVKFNGIDISKKGNMFGESLIKYCDPNLFGIISSDKNKVNTIKDVDYVQYSRIPDNVLVFYNEKGLKYECVVYNPIIDKMFVWHIENY